MSRKPVGKFLRSYMLCHMRGIWATIRHLKSYNKTSTGQTTPWRCETTCWGVRSASQRKVSIGCQLDFFNLCNFQNRSGVTSAWILSWVFQSARRKNDGILTVVDRATKMVHLVPVQQTIMAADTAHVYWDNIGRLHGIPRSFVSDRDPRFISKFW